MLRAHRLCATSRAARRAAAAPAAAAPARRCRAPPEPPPLLPPPPRTAIAWCRCRRALVGSPKIGTSVMVVSLASSREGHMNERRTADQIQRLLREVERDRAKGLTVGDCCRKLG